MKCKKLKMLVLCVIVLMCTIGIIGMRKEGTESEVQAAEISIKGVSADYSGLYKYENNWYYVKKGAIDYNYTGLCKYNGSWWYVSKGKVDFGATGLCKYNGSWWYVSGGKVNFGATGLCKYNGSWWYVSKGKVDFGATGLCKYNGSWWYVSKGKVDFGATGLCKYNGSWWYVKNGKLDFGYTGLCKYNGSWWYIKSGKLDFGYTGLCQYNGSWWYIKNGKLDFGYTGLCQYEGNWYNVKNGVMVSRVDEEDSEVKKEVTLQVMGSAEVLDEAQGAWLKTRCEDFADEHPNWEITFEYVVCSEVDAKDTVLQDVANAADVYMFTNDQLKSLVDGGAIAKLDGEAAEYVKTSNSESVAATVMLNGDVYGVPYTSNTWFMYYDKRVFSKEDVKSMETMLEKGKVAFPLSNAWYLSAFFTANGCTFYGNGSDEAAGIDLGGDKGTAVAKYIVDLVNHPNFVFDNNSGSLGLAGLEDGSVNAWFNGSWNYNNVVENIGLENVGVAQLPTININGENKQMKAFLGTQAIGVNPNADDIEVAEALATFLGNEESQLMLFKCRGNAPVATVLATDDTIATDPIAVALANVAVNTSICQPVFGMEGYWMSASSFGEAFHPEAEYQITADNAAEKVQAFNDLCNGRVEPESVQFSVRVTNSEGTYILD